MRIPKGPSRRINDDHGIRLFTAVLPIIMVTLLHLLTTLGIELHGDIGYLSSMLHLFPLSELAQLSGLLVIGPRFLIMTPPSIPLHCILVLPLRSTGIHIDIAEQLLVIDLG